METKTHWKKLVNPNYLGAYSLNPGQELILTIKKVVREKVIGAAGKKEECTVCYFVENVKPMIFNRLNQKTISKIHGTPYIEDWEGKQIQVYAEMVDAFGERVEALRVRPTMPNKIKPELMFETDAYTKAVDFVKGGGSIDDIKKKYTVTDEMFLKLSEYVSIKG